MPEERQQSRQVTPEAETISDAQVHSLAEQIAQPSRYTQRCVEQMGFVPEGGLNWRRTIQVRVPSWRATTEDWWPIHLGTFPRKRFADLVVTDSAGHRVSLLTRRQHGHALARVLLQPHIETIGTAPSWWMWQRRSASRQSDTPQQALLESLSNLLTLMPSGNINARDRAEVLDDEFWAYGLSEGIPESVIHQANFALGMSLVPEMRYTRYLCWIRAIPGAIVTLSATYSALDVVRRPPGRPQRLRPVKQESHSRIGVWRRQFKKRTPPLLMRTFQIFGYAPLRYAVATPTNTDANSYYFTVSPPATTSTLALITDVDGSHPSDGEVDSAAHCFHVHNEGAVREHPGAVLWPYLLPERREHTLIAAGAVLNIIFVYLISHGHFVNGISAQTWLLLTPTVLTGILAQQQTHYYAYATRYQRLVLWIYLALGVAFLVTVTFSHQEVVRAGVEWQPFARTIFIAFATYSTFIAFIYSLGPRFEAITNRRMRRLTLAAAKKAERKRAKDDHRDPTPIDQSKIRFWIGREAVVRYQKAVLQFCFAALSIATVCALVVCYTGLRMSRSGEMVESAMSVRVSPTPPQLVGSFPVTGHTMFTPVGVFPRVP